MDAAPRPPKISVEAVTKLYGRKGEVRALENVDLEINEGEFVCLVGPSGCGKSTLLRMIADLHYPTSGSVKIQASGPGLTTAMVFQNYSIFPWKTVAENIGLPLEVNGTPKAERVDRVAALMDRMNLSDFADALPSALSGGMAQRVSIARALAVQPEILLMDEPFAALDAQMRRILQDELLSIWQEDQRTVVFVTHSLEEAILLGDRVVVMSARPGKIIGDYRIPFERPRRPEVRGTKEFAELEQEIWSQMRGEVERANK
ncbi:ABC transporter ATP-binding protein [Microterricola pindariensis]|uniref:Mannosyltransferase n=1 Tax=Microterricola pindariensis TaxID=478010 RepID=A0ABX5AVA6_9MICO|nr:ABC transporter ATP-binding protein [Microterricola pindariensis]PPL17194.1 mannosyltransferase [Microterricola pindariensis]